MSSVPHRTVKASVLVASVGLALAACSDVGPIKPPLDTGNNDVLLCSSTEDCPTGFLCQSGLCTENACFSDADCGSGLQCNPLTGQCEEKPTGPTDPTEPTEPTDPGEEPEPGAPCTTKYDCNADQICKNGTCADPTSNQCGNDADCVKGQICNFAKQCEDGCESDTDCPAPKLCHPQKFVCETCSISNPCAQGKSCVDGKCEASAACSTTKDCVNAGKDGTVCLEGRCLNCTRHTDCYVDPYKSEQRTCGLDGLCATPSCDPQKCQEQLGNPNAYCDNTQNPPSCQIPGGCTTDADCAASILVCDFQTYTCVGADVNCNTAACNQECGNRGQQCNQATCTCAGTGSGQSCISDLECPAGMVCSLNVCSSSSEDAMIECIANATNELDMMMCMFMGCSQPGASLLATLGLLALFMRRRRQEA